MKKHKLPRVLWEGSLDGDRYRVVKYRDKDNNVTAALETGTPDLMGVERWTECTRYAAREAGIFARALLDLT